ncbi:hypothetical protein FACS1894166_09560 [Bacilli bacterium]|nr:hypothetical protein FACS1894166_09560 [Bacilli bacterium]
MLEVNGQENFTFNFTDRCIVSKGNLYYGVEPDKKYETGNPISMHL